MTWTRSADAPLVQLIDEIDAMVGDSLVSVLRQLRAGYAERPDGFPQSVVLCGVRDVRDYRIPREFREVCDCRRQRLQHQGQVASDDAVPWP